MHKVKRIDESQSNRLSSGLWVALIVTKIITGDFGCNTFHPCMVDVGALPVQGGKEISPWHDIPLKAETPDTFNYVCEIPKL